MRLFCAECPRVSGDEARGWRLARADVPEAGEEPQLVAFCPACGAREFGPLRDSDGRA